MCIRDRRVSALSGRTSFPSATCPSSSTDFFSYYFNNTKLPSIKAEILFLFVQGGVLLRGFPFSSCTLTYKSGLFCPAIVTVTRMLPVGLGPHQFCQVKRISPIV